MRKEIYNVESSLLNIVNDKAQFKKELSDKIKSLDIGESIKVLVNNRTRIITKISEKDAEISE